MRLPIQLQRIMARWFNKAPEFTKRALTINKITDTTETASSTEADDTLKSMHSFGDKMTEFLEKGFFKIGLC
jgi:hypothetical protein